MTRKHNPRQPDPKDMISSIVHDEATKRLIFIAESNSGQWFSMPIIREDSGDSECEMLAEYIRVLADRTDRDIEELLRKTIHNLNNHDP